MKRVYRILLAAVVAAMMMVPSFADVPEGVSIDLPEGYTMTELMEAESHTANYPEKEYSYNIGTIQREETASYELAEICYFVDSGRKDEPVPELNDAEEFCESISEGLMKNILQMSSISFGIGEFYRVELESGETAITASDRDEEVMESLIIEPMGNGLLRVFHIKAETEQAYEELLAAAGTYQDTDSVRQAAMDGISEGYAMAAKVKKEQEENFLLQHKKVLLALVAFLIIVFVFITTWRRYHKFDNAKYEAYDPEKQGLIPVEVTCAMCGKKFTVYAAEGQVEMKRKTANRCPECEKPIKEAAKVSGFLTPWR